ncbi:MAG: hypothetical protein FVQ79_04220 [Planctomycetes bacterium]|nr:hypothetical protein [Planctomycetota bacterium]
MGRLMCAQIPKTFIRDQLAEWLIECALGQVTPEVRDLLLAYSWCYVAATMSKPMRDEIEWLPFALEALEKAGWEF